MTTTSSISPADIAADVGEFETACECVHCAPHATGSGCRCDHPATWIVQIVHMSEQMCGIVVALCDPCLDAAKAWAVLSATQLGELNGGRCYYCKAPVRCADDMLNVVALK